MGKNEMQHLVCIVTAQILAIQYVNDGQILPGDGTSETDWM